MTRLVAFIMNLINFIKVNSTIEIPPKQLKIPLNLPLRKGEVLFSPFEKGD